MLEMTLAIKRKRKIAEIYRAKKAKKKKTRNGGSGRLKSHST